MTDLLIRLVAEQKTDTVRGRHSAAIVFQISQMMGESVPEVVAALGGVTAAAISMGMGQAIREVTNLEATMGVEGSAARLELVEPAIPVDAVLRISDPQQLLVQGFADDVRQAVADSLGVSVAAGEGVKPAAKRLKEAVEKKQWELERIARTETNNAINAAHLAQLREVSLDFPEMQLWKQWSAELGDGKCCDFCASLDGQVRKVDEEFEDDTGWKGDAPSRHPNCRCRVNGYSPRWNYGKQPEYGMTGDDTDPFEEGEVEEVAMKRIDSLADVPDYVKKTMTPSQQNAYRRAYNASLVKDGPTASQVHVDTPMGSRGPKKDKRRAKDDQSRVVKSEKARRYTLGVVYEPLVEDSQGDFATAEEIEKACWEFNRTHIGTGKDGEIKKGVCHEGCTCGKIEKGALGIQHASWIDSHGEIIESYIAPCDMVVGEQTVAKGTWLMGVIWSPTNWKKIQRGELTGYSLGGKAQRVDPNG